LLACTNGVVSNNPTARALATLELTGMQKLPHALHGDAQSLRGFGDAEPALDHQISVHEILPTNKYSLTTALGYEEQQSNCCTLLLYFAPVHHQDPHPGSG